MTIFLIKYFILASLVVLPFTLVAAPLTSCEKSYRALAQPQQDTSVELEMSLEDHYLHILTTKTGKIGVMFDEIEASSVSTELLEKMKVKTFEALKEMNWDGLDNSRKKFLLQYVSQHKKTSFFDDRRYPGMMVRPKIALVFPKPVFFLGKNYPAGQHEIDFSGIMGKVEYKNVNQSWNSVELHFRARYPAGDVSKDARNFQRGIGATETHQHVHEVALLPLEKLKVNTRQQVTRMSEYFRRTNFMAEMMGVKAGIKLKRNAKDDVIYFDNLSADSLAGVTRYFKDVANRYNRAISDEFKLAWVGFRGSDKYDGPDKIYGYEFRKVSKYESEETEEFLNEVQYGMSNDDYGVTPEKMSEWMDKYHQDRKEIEIVDSLWYNQTPEKLMANAHPKIKKLFGENEQPIFLKDVDDIDKARKMLLYDWTKDVLIFDKPKLQKEILKKQVEAILRVKNGEDPSKVVKEFITNSGVYEIFRQSFKH